MSTNVSPAYIYRIIDIKTKGSRKYMKTLKNYIRRVIKDVIKEAISNNRQFLFNSPSIPHSVLNNFTLQKITTAYKQFKLKLDPYSNIRNTDFKFTFF